MLRTKQMQNEIAISRAREFKLVTNLVPICRKPSAIFILYVKLGRARLSVVMILSGLGVVPPSPCVSSNSHSASRRSRSLSASIIGASLRNTM